MALMYYLMISVNYLVTKIFYLMTVSCWTQLASVDSLLFLNISSLASRNDLIYII